MKNVLFINSGFEIGGIETFLVRAAEQLSCDVKFTILIMSDAINIELLEKFKKFGEVVFLRDLLLVDVSKYAILRTLLPLNKKRVKKILADINIIHASCSFSLPLMRKLSKILGDDVLESVGVYHSREFLWGRKKRLMRKLQLSLFKTIPNNNVIFMNDYTVNLYSKEFNSEYNCALPIGVDVNLYAKCNPNQMSGRIVSIGRLVDFKTYNRHMIEYLASLPIEVRDKYHFEVYGDGPELSELKDKAMEKEVKVYFHGKLQYKDMAKVLNGSSLFIGSGTAIVEAAAAGVPSIIGIESIEQPLTYGFITNTTGLSFQEQGLDYPLYKYDQIMCEFFNLTAQDYDLLSSSHRTRAEVFSTDNMRLTLLNYYENLSHCSKELNFGANYIFSTLQWLILNKFKLCDERNTMYDF